MIPQPGALVGLLALRAGLEEIPAATWPLEGALETLRGHAHPDGAIAAAMARLPGGPVRPDVRVPGVRSLLRSLVLNGQCMPAGTGWEARLVVDTGWVDAHRPLFELLSAPDRRAIDLAAQRLHAMSTIASKKLAA
jgi:hypothetical protein